MHALNGNVETPLFHHLGASSWHSFDAFLIVSIGKLGPRILGGFVIVAAIVAVAVWAALLQLRAVKRSGSPFRRRVSEDGGKRPEEVSIKFV